MPPHHHKKKSFARHGLDMGKKYLLQLVIGGALTAVAGVAGIAVWNKICDTASSVAAVPDMRVTETNILARLIQLEQDENRDRWQIYSLSNRLNGLPKP